MFRWNITADHHVRLALHAALLDGKCKAQQVVKAGSCDVCQSRGEQYGPFGGKVAGTKAFLTGI